MAGFRNIAAPMGANGKAKTENGNEKRNRNENHNRNEIAPPHRPATANSWASAGGTHRLEARRDGMGATDGPRGGETSGSS